MREILFRGKRIDDYVNDKSIDYTEKGVGEWVYGDIIHRRYYKNKDVVVIRTEDSGFDNYSDYEVDPSTVGQYTGLTDKNGKRIFEGDILSIAKKGNGIGDYFYPPIKYPSNAIVKWDKCSWMWEIIAKPRYYLTFPNAWCHFECEVIGNATDNPELLEVRE